MNLKSTTLFLFIFLFSLPLFAQFELPKIDFDKTELVKDEEKRVNKKVFSKKDQTVLEIHYPIKGSIQSYCNRSNVVYDSVYIYQGEEVMEIKFQVKSNIYKSWWKQNGKIVHSEVYHKNKQLYRKYAQIGEIDNSNPSPRCGRDYYFIGKYYEYDETGKQVIYKNYDTGEFIPKEKKPDNNRKQLAQLKKKADKIIIENYGKSFFKKNIRNNIYRSAAYNSKSYSSRKNNGQPGVKNDGWFEQWEEAVTYADFSYDIAFSDEERYPLIRIRVDRDGNLVKAVNRRYSTPKSFTRGLLEEEPKKILSKKDAIKLAIKNGLPKDDPDMAVDLIWMPSSEGSATGKLQYEIIFNKLERKVWGCNITNFEKWLIDPVSKIIEKDGEEDTGECAVSDTYIRKGGPDNKYGVISEFKDEPLISYSYDYIQSGMSYFLIVKKDGKTGVIDHKENVLIPFEYSYIMWIKTKKKRYFRDYCRVRKGGSYALFSKEGKMVLPFEFQSFKDEGRTIIGNRSDGTKVIFDMETKTVK